MVYVPHNRHNRGTGLLQCRILADLGKDFFCQVPLWGCFCPKLGSNYGGNIKVNGLG